MKDIKDYKRGIRIAIKRLLTGKKLTAKEYTLLRSIKDYLNTKNFNLENIDYHLKNNTKEYKRCLRLHIRFETFSRALCNNILVNTVSKQYSYIKL